MWRNSGAFKGKPTLPTTSGSKQRLYKFDPLDPIRELTAELVDAGPVAELGCGHGRQAAFILARKNVRIVGVDIRKFQSYARAVGYEFIRADVRYLPFRNGCFPVTLSSNFLGGVNYDVSMRHLDEMSRVTRLGGIAIVSFRNSAHPKVRLNEWLWRLQYAMNIKYCFGLGEIVRRFRKHGLIAEKCVAYYPPSKKMFSPTTLFRLLVDRYFKRYDPTLVVILKKLECR